MEQTSAHAGESAGKLRIRRAAREAIIANGFDLAASRAITSAAGVSPALLFHHYRSVEECLIDAVETSVRDLFDRYHAVASDLTDPVLRARVLLEWHLPVTDEQRREWLLSFEFVRASFRLPSIAGVVEQQYDRWHRTIVSEYRAIAPGLSPADAAVRARRLMGLSEGLSWQLILGNPSVPEATVRQILAETMGADLGLASEVLRVTAPRRRRAS
jgi:AcrR family transcriptional regulator